MMPAAICAGVSYSDFWRMTYGETANLVKFYFKHEKQITAFNAFWSGAWSQARDLPKSAPDAFPEIFDRESKVNGIKVENWQLSKVVMAERVKQFNEQHKKNKAVNK